jgi:hypothetical protein
MSATLGCTWVQAIFRREAQCGLHGVAQTEGRKARRGSWDVGRGTGRGKRGARGGRFSRWKDRLPGCDAGRRGCLPKDWGRGVKGREGREEVPAHVPQAFCGRRYPPTFHGWALLPRRRFESRKRLVKTGSRGSLNSPKDPSPTQSPLSGAREIRRGRARV